jgi:hypothetical protein
VGLKAPAPSDGSLGRSPPLVGTGAPTGAPTGAKDSVDGSRTISRSGLNLCFKHRAVLVICECG